MRCNGTAIRAAGFRGASNSPPRRGVTLTEAVLFISVALGVIVGGLVVFEQARVSDMAMEYVRLSRMVQTAARDLVRGGDLEGCIGAETLAAGQYVPAAYLHDADGDGVVDQFRSPKYDNVFLTARICGPGHGPSEARDLDVNTIQFMLFGLNRSTCTRVLPVDESGQGMLGDDIAMIVTVVFNPDIEYLYLYPSAGDVITPSYAAFLCGAQTDPETRSLGRMSVLLRF